MKFSIICDDEITISKAIDLYNRTYKTDFQVLEFVEDEVLFATIITKEEDIRHVFDLGRMYGRMGLRNE